MVDTAELPTLYSHITYILCFVKAWPGQDNIVIVSSDHDSHHVLLEEVKIVIGGTSWLILNLYT